MTTVGPFDSQQHPKRRKRKSLLFIIKIQSIASICVKTSPHDLWTGLFYCWMCVASSADGQGIHGWAYWSAFHVVIVYWLKTWYQTCVDIQSLHMASKRNMWYGVNTFRLWSWLRQCRWRGRLDVFSCISKGKKRNKKVSSSVTVMA